MTKLLLALAALLYAGAAWAHDYQLGALKIEQPFARATVTQTGGAYLAIDNAGPPDRLLRAETAVAQSAELHEHIMDGNVMKMRAVQDGLALPAGRTALSPGGYHIMLLGLKAPLKEGDSFALKLVFEKAGTVEIMVKIDKPGAMGPGGAPAAAKPGDMHKH